MGGCLLVVPPGTKATSTKYPLSERRERRTNWRRCSYPFVFATILHVPRIAIKNFENILKKNVDFGHTLVYLTLCLNGPSAPAARASKDRVARRPAVRGRSARERCIGTRSPGSSCHSAATPSVRGCARVDPPRAGHDLRPGGAPRGAARERPAARDGRLCRFPPRPSPAPAGGDAQSTRASAGASARTFREILEPPRPGLCPDVGLRHRATRHLGPAHGGSAEDGPAAGRFAEDGRGLFIRADHGKPVARAPARRDS